MAVANSRSPSASSRVTRNVSDAVLWMLRPNRLPRKPYAVISSPAMYFGSSTNDTTIRPIR
jgi:hypothetical protein